MARRAIKLHSDCRVSFVGFAGGINETVAGLRGRWNWLAVCAVLCCAVLCCVVLFCAVLSGPFLVVCPNSTLHQWQQEVSKFCPALRVLPYWGSQQDRALLRKYWTPQSLGSAESSFHVLVTSYHTIVADAKYFNRLKWQYLLCLARGTPVTTQCGLCRPIEQCVQRGLFLLSSCGPRGSRRGRLSHDRLAQGSVGSNDRGVRAVVRLTLEDGRHIDCTGDHRVLTAQRGWVEAAQLRWQQSAQSLPDEIVCGPDGVLDSQPSEGSDEGRRERSFHLVCTALPPFHMRSACARQRSLSLARLLGYIRTEGECCAATLTGHTVVEHPLDAELVCNDIREVCSTGAASPPSVSRHSGSCQLLRVHLPTALVVALLQLCGGASWCSQGRSSTSSSPSLAGGISPHPLPSFCLLPSTPLSFVRESLAGVMGAAAATCALADRGGQRLTARSGGEGDSDAAVAQRLAFARSSAACGTQWQLTPVSLPLPGVAAATSTTSSVLVSTRALWSSQVHRMLRRLGVDHSSSGHCAVCSPLTDCGCALLLPVDSFHTRLSFRYSWSSQLPLSVASSFVRQQRSSKASPANNLSSAARVACDSPVGWLDRVGAMPLFARRRCLPHGESTIPSFRLRVLSVASRAEPCDVFDLSVAAHPSFVANGLTVHNWSAPYRPRQAPDTRRSVHSLTRSLTRISHAALCAVCLSVCLLSLPLLPATRRSLSRTRPVSAGRVCSTFAAATAFC